MGKTARTAVSIPAPLKARMNAVREAVNWSAVAAAAFEAKLDEIDTRKEKKTVKDIITRLRESKRKTETSQYQKGFAAGREWATEKAEAVELERLGKERDDHVKFGGRFAVSWEVKHDEDKCVVKPPDRLVRVIKGPDYEETDYKGGELENVFWRELFTDDELNPELVRGFAEGALEVWDEVKDKL